MIIKIFEKTIPNFILRYREKIAIKKIRKKFSKMKQYETFREIYLKKLWSPESIKSDHKFYSGVGSYFPEFVDKYIDEIEKPKDIDWNILDTINEYLLCFLSFHIINIKYLKSIKLVI